MKKIILALVFVIFSLVGISAQTPTPTPSPTPKSVEKDEEVVKILTNLIQVDVTVTDSKGKIVTDIKPEEIEIYENGKKQQISNFSFISNVKEVTQTEKNPNETTGVPIPPKTLRPEQIRRTIALVVDDLTLSFESTYYVRRALKKFVDEQMRDGDLVAIIRTGAGIGALQQFTSDKRMLYAAIEKVRWNPIGNGGIGAFAPLEGLPPAATEEEKEAIQRMQQSEKDANNFRESVFSTGTLGAINYIVRGMQDLPGRKSIMLLSDGFALFTQDENGFKESSRVLDSIRRLIDAANRASVVINTMDARGLQVLGLTAADNTGGRTSEEVDQAMSDRKDKLFDTQAGLQYLAQQTGGKSIVNNNDLSGEIRKVLDDQSYYLVGYQPDEETFDPVKRRFNRLDVKVIRKGVKVRYRSGFFGIANTDIQRSASNTQTPAQQILTALTSPFAANGISLKLNTLFGKATDNNVFVHSFLHVEAKDLKFTDEPDGSKKAVFDVLAVNFGENGVVVDQISKTYTLTVKDDMYQKIIKEGFVYNFLFPVKKPGAYQMRVAIRDSNANVGSANQFIEVPDLKKGRLTLSGIVLENMTEAQWKVSQTTPSANATERGTNPMQDTSLRRFKRGTVLRYATEIYNAKLDQTKKPKINTQIRVFRDGKLILEGKPIPFNLEGQNDFGKMNFMGALALGEAMEVGDYVLQIVVIDNQAKAKRNLANQWVQFEIVE